MSNELLIILVEVLFSRYDSSFCMPFSRLFNCNSQFLVFDFVSYRFQKNESFAVLLYV